MEPNDLPLQDPEAVLEMLLINQYLKEKGYSIKDLCNLPPELSRRLMCEACTYASGKMAEVESKYKFLIEVQYPP